MADAKFYDSNQVHLSLGDRPIASGRDEGEFVSSDYEANAVNKTVGADGEVSVSRSNNRSATITIKVMQTSESHTLLTQLYEAQLAAPNGGFLTYELRDITGGKLEHAAKVWFEKAPPSAYGANAGVREWKLGCAELIREVV